MDHVFKKAKYTVSLAVTLVFFSIVVTSYVDSITCPMILQLATEGSLASAIVGGHSRANQNQMDRASPQHQQSLLTNEPSTLMNRFLNLPRSIFDSNYTYFPCNVADVLLQIYAVWFIIFMLHKWIIYKQAGWHYFMLDYCYFHNFLMIFMILSAIVSIDVYEADGSIRNHRWNADDIAATMTVARAAKEGDTTTENQKQNPQSPNAKLSDLPDFWDVILGIAYDGSESAVSMGVFRYYVGDVARAVIPVVAERAIAKYEAIAESLHDDGDANTRQAGTIAALFRAVLSTPKSTSFSTETAYHLDTMIAPFSSAPSTFAGSFDKAGGNNNAGGGLSSSSSFKPTIAIRVAPARYALGSMPPLSQVRFVVIFVMFLGGTFGPIMGAIVVWQNALLFHSFDKMTACYLHLAPALVQIIIMCSVYETSDMAEQLVGIYKVATQGLSEEERPPMPSLMMRSSSSASTFDSLQGGNGNGYFAPIDTKAILNHYLTIPNILLSHVAFFLFWQLFYHVTFSLMAVRRERAFAKKMLKQGKLKTLGDCGTNPTARVTAYTWMMANPPGGKAGFRYRLVCIFGEGETPTKIMFSVVQLGFHLVYICVSLPVLYVALKWREEPSWLLGYLSLFLLVAIANASTVMGKWIEKLQRAADEKKVKQMEIAEQNEGNGAAASASSVASSSTETLPSDDGKSPEGNTSKRKGGK